MTPDAFRVCDEKFESSLKGIVTKLRAEQTQALLHLITGRDVFVNLPTGFGKSLIYQLAPSIVEEMSHLDGKTGSAIILVISPLVSLMEDQVQYLQQKGIKASFIGGEQSKMELTSLHELYRSRHLYIWCSLFGHSTLFVASVVFMKALHVV